MDHIAIAQLLINPSGIHAYFDRVQLWLLQPVERAALDCLRQHCGHLFVDNRPLRSDWRYRQRLDFKQPELVALEWCVKQESAIANMGEVALDLIFDDFDQREDALEFLNRYLVRRWHGKHQKIQFIGTTRYDAARYARNATVLYPQEHSRLTGERNVVHLEWRLRGVKAMRRVGIHQPADLLIFNFREFWEERLLLYDVNKERLGRYWENTRTGSKRRRYEYMDSRRGHTILNSHATIQELIDNYRSFRLQRVLRRLDVSELLSRV